MDFDQLTDEVRTQLRAEHAARYPELAVLPLSGDGGKAVRLPLILVNPKGSCAPLEGVKLEGSWPLIVGPSIGFGQMPPNLSDQIMRECVVWPDKTTLAKHATRWPDLPLDIANAVMKKMGATPGNIVRPADDEQPPAPIAAAMAANPRAAWRRVRVSKTEQLAIVIDPPSGAVWRLSKTAFASPTAWKAMFELAHACIKGCATLEGEPRAVGEVFDRWPGIAALMMPAISALMGVAEEIELGEL